MQPTFMVSNVSQFMELLCIIFHKWYIPIKQNLPRISAYGL